MKQKKWIIDKITLVVLLENLYCLYWAKYVKNKSIKDSWKKNDVLISLYI